MESKTIKVSGMFEFQKSGTYGRITQTGNEYADIETVICRSLEMADGDRLVTNASITVEIDSPEIQQKCCQCYQDKTLDKLKHVEVETVKYDKSELVKSEVFVCFDCMPRYFESLANRKIEWQLEQLGASVAPELEGQDCEHGVMSES